jgi:Protein of unknown function (DUF4230)
MKTILSYLLVIAVTLFASWFFFGKKMFNEVSEITNDAAVTKIQAIGKLELVQINIKDILEYTVKRDYLPDSRMLIMVNGEMAGCIDLQKLSGKNITVTKDTLYILLPAPEVCYTKINHNKSKVYNASTFSWLDNETQLVEGLYKKADAYFASDSIRTIIVAETKKNAPTVLVPLLENLSNKKVILRYQ